VIIFAGIVFSIPFLPPIDGGSRFYASTVPFLYAPLSIAPIVLIRHKTEVENHPTENEIWFERAFPILLAILTMFSPILLRQVISPGSFTAPDCPADQEPFVTRIYPRSYVELMRVSSPACGFAPNICLGDFQQYSQEKTTDDFYQELERLAGAANASMWIVPSVDLVDRSFHYLVDNSSFLDGLGTPPLSIQGCAVEIKTKTQSIYQIMMLEPVTTP
jgi:hypothetical protein